MMQAVQYPGRTKNDFSKIRVNSIPKPILDTPGYALIRIHAASLNPADIFFSNMPPPLQCLGESGCLPCLNACCFRPCLNFNLTNFAIPSYPFIPGCDFSGVIESVIYDVKNFKVGDAVFSLSWGSEDSLADEYGHACGTFAEYIAFKTLQKAKQRIT